MADEQPPPRVPPRAPRKRPPPSRTASPGPPEAPADLKGWLLHLAATKTPPVGSGAAALALWTAWIAHLVRPALRDYFHAAAGLMLVVAIFYNRLNAMGREKLARERREKLVRDAERKREKGEGNAERDEGAP